MMWTGKKSVAGKRLMFIACLLLHGYAIAQPKPEKIKHAIHFINQSLDGALRLARQLHKPVFVDAYATWCAPCRELKRQTFTDQQVAAYFNAHYISITVDVEKGQGVKFAERYQVDSYPTLLFIDGEGKVIKRMEGFVDARQLAEVAAGIK